MPISFISYVNNNERYGFIDSPELGLDQIFFHSTNRKKSYIHIHKGDKVSFEYNIETDSEDGAKEISFLRNISLDGLKNDFEKGNILKGFLYSVASKMRKNANLALCKSNLIQRQGRI